jgi:integration host factor subunit alpha
MTLTKADIVAKVYAEGLLTKAEAAEAVEHSLELVKAALENEEEVLVSGFGKWSVRRKAARRGRNPQTGEPLTLPPRKVVTFRPSRVLKAKVQEAPGGEAPSAPGGGPEGEGGGVIRRGYF